MKMTRGQFLRILEVAGALAGTSLLGVSLVGCGGEDDADGGGAGGSCEAAISANHAHGLAVSDADLAAGVDKTYDITQGATHSHTVTITAADFAKLAAGEAVTLSTSTGAGHAHTITVSC